MGMEASHHSARLTPVKGRGKEVELGRMCPEHDTDLTKSQPTQWGVVEQRLPIRASLWVEMVMS